MYEILVEQRPAGDPPLPKCDSQPPRKMVKLQNLSVPLVTFRLGGLLSEDDEGRLLIANGNNETIGFRVADTHGLPLPGLTLLWFADLGQTFRAMPRVSLTKRTGTEPWIYIEEREPAGIKALRVDDGSFEQIFAGDGTIGHLSYSSPAVLPESGHVFFGSAVAPGGVFKVNPAQTWGAALTTPTPTEPAWFDFNPSNAWRTAGAFTHGSPSQTTGERKRLVHIGSAESILYTFNADEPCGVVEWCYDAQFPVKQGNEGGGGECDPGAPESARPQCCNDVLDTTFGLHVNYPPGQPTSSLPTRRMQDKCISCWDANKKLVPCNKARILVPTDQDTWNMALAATVQIIVGYFNAQDAGIPSSVVIGEWMNETTGKFGSLTKAGAFGWLSNVPIQAGSNRIRVALYDANRNEAFDRVTVNACSGPCP